MHTIDSSAPHQFAPCSRPKSLIVNPAISSRGHLFSTAAFHHSIKRLKYSKAGQAGHSDPLVVTVEGDASDAWRLNPVIKRLKEGAVGIIPTDTNVPSLVCDLEDREAVLRLYCFKQVQPKDTPVLLCRSLHDMGHYTAGFPASHEPGQPDWFKRVHRVLPGPYVLILPASRNVPAHCLPPALRTKALHERKVGVALPVHPVTQALMSSLDRPLLSIPLIRPGYAQAYAPGSSSSAAASPTLAYPSAELGRLQNSQQHQHTRHHARHSKHEHNHEYHHYQQHGQKELLRQQHQHGASEAPGAAGAIGRNVDAGDGDMPYDNDLLASPDLGWMLEEYGPTSGNPQAVDFVVYTGASEAVLPTVVDMTEPTPRVVQRGAGDTSAFE